ncbi:hypothetical protein EUTSA_v10002791mg [Eutrema salsugineum]|uniref:F-box domain-containing protein n=1 Tax=Eutrema salsugineum TaxID=72664 RepID=V4LBM1_EUTSA|nr:hypothetical protein EUTSA_v10002791mg [Eutrema salsugineum]
MKKTTMISNLPLELESEILSRVPANSLSQLRSTCKRWYVLFRDSRFIKKNLVNINLHGTRNRFDPSFEFTGKLNSLKNKEHVEISKIFHCDGLLLCTTKDNKLVVWNPCTGQIRWIKFGTMHHTYDLQRRSVSKLEIYEFNSDSWRVLDGITYDWYPWFNLSGGVSLKGNTYWFHEYQNYHRVSSIVMFDFTTERLGHISLPFQTDDEDMVANTKIDEAKDLSWSDFLVVDIGKLMIQGGLKRIVSFLVDEENKMVVCCGIEQAGEERINRIHIVGENMHKEVYKESTKISRSYDWPLLTDSLNHRHNHSLYYFDLSIIALNVVISYFCN